MTYQPLHHKYRPQTFAQLVGQPAIAATLSQAIATDRIAPAYLLTGPRGTGKTSSARIFAKSLNCLESPAPTPEPCGTCESCRAIASGSALDVIEIDAASNTGVDNIRELIERAQFAPVQCRYKLYLIDEVHMLSTAAFNALLKTLEEPPPRVIFVLATTDPQRVLPTIISRCQRFDFRRIPLPELVDRLQEIARLENISLTPAAIAQVAQLANGGLRDAESLLDQLSLLPGTVDIAQVWDLVGSIPEEDLLALTRSLRAGDTVATLAQARQLLDRGREPLTLLQSLAGFFRDLLVAQAAPERGDLVNLSPAIWEQLCAEAQHWGRDRILTTQKSLKDSELQIKNATQPRLWLEVALLTLGTATLTTTDAEPQALPAASPNKLVATQAPVAPPAAAIPSPVPVSPAPVVAETAIAPQQTPEKAPEKPLEPVPTLAREQPPAVPSAAPPASASTAETPNLQPLWRQVMAKLPPATRALVGQHCCLLALDGALATVGVRNANLLRLAESKKPNLETAFAEVCQQKTTVRLEVAPAEFAPTEPAARSSPTDPPAAPTAPTAPPPTPPTASEPPATAPAPDRRQPTTAAKPAASRKSDRAKPAAKSKTAPPTYKSTNVPADLQAAVQALAGDFNGEPIDLGDRADWQGSPPAPSAPADPATPVPDDDDPDGFMDFGGNSSSPEDDEVPFARQPPTGDPWDLWEVAAQRPSQRCNLFRPSPAGDLD